MLKHTHNIANANLRGSTAQKSSSIEQKVVSYVESFTSIRKNSYWPLPFSSEDSIVSTFGPIVNHETKEYEFNRGLDIAGLEGDNTAFLTGLESNLITTTQRVGIAFILT